MAAQENPKRKKPAAKPNEEAGVAHEQARVEPRAAETSAKAEERARLKAEEGLAGAQETLAAAQAEVEQERQARVKLELTLAKAQAALAAVQAEIEQERQARGRAEQARAEAERALAAAEKTTEVEAETMELPPTAPGEENTEQRVSFIVRLTVDERGQPRRTEVEHARSGQKTAFPGLDGERLAVFMQACLNLPTVPEPAVPAVRSPVRVEAPTSQPVGPAASLTVSAVGVLREGVPGVMALTLNAAEAFVIQVRFQLQGPAALSLTAQEPSYEMQVYAHEVTSGMSTLLTRYRANLVKDVLEYTSQTQAPGLVRGLYRLITLVTLQAPTKMVGHHEGPIVHVAKARQPTPELL